MKNVVLFSDREEVKRCIEFLKKNNIQILCLVSNALKASDFDIPVKKSLDGNDYAQSILISYYYSSLIQQAIFNKFYKSVNFHPAPMPYYRGVKCGVFAIINGEEKFGVTCHEVNEKFDDGKILGKINNTSSHFCSRRNFFKSCAGPVA